MSDSHENLTERGGLLPGERPTLKTLSRITGMAVATVSRALNDAPDIGDDTKVRVRAAARQIGYRPNRAGVRLRTGKTNVIALLLSTEHEVMNHTARLISSVAAGFRATPYHMIITPYFPDEDPMDAVRYVVETRSADAVILNQTQPRDPRVAYLMEQGFPFATHGRTDWADRHAYFDFDNTAYARVATQALAAHGRRNVLLIAPPMFQNYAANMRDGMLAAAAESGISVKVLSGATSDDPNDMVAAAVAAHFAAHPDTDGIICASVMACMGATAAVEGSGRTIGQHIDLVAKEAIPFLATFRPAIMAVKEDVGEAGRFLADAARHAVEHPDEPPMQFLDVPVQVG